MIEHELIYPNLPKELNFADQDVVIEAFFKSLDIKEKSKKDYRKNLFYFFSYLSHKKQTQPTREDILDYKNNLLKIKKPTTVNTYLTPIRLYFTFTAAVGIYPNITIGIKRAKDSKNYKKDALAVFQAKRLIQTIKNRDSETQKRDLAIVNLLLRTGLRDIEVVRADVGDISTTAGEIVLYVHGKGRNSKDEYVVLTESCYTYIMDYLATRNNPDDQEPLFISVSNRNLFGRMTTRSISRIVKNALIESGYCSPRLTAHSLRHTAVTFSLLGGASIQETQSMARHSNIETTMRYAHNVNRLQNAAEKKIDQLLDNI